MENKTHYLFDLYNTCGTYFSRIEFARVLMTAIFNILKDRHELREDFAFSQDKHYGDILTRNIRVIPAPELDKLQRRLNNLTSADLRDLARGAFDFALETEGRFMESTSKEIALLAIKLLRFTGGDLLYDLGSGYGNFLIEAHNYAQKHNFIYKDLFGIEMNPITRIYSLMNLEISQCHSYRITEGDFEEGLPHMYNKGFVFPPIGLRMRDNKRIIDSKLFNYSFNANQNSYEWLFVDRLLDGLIGHDQRAVAVLSLKCLYSKEDKEYRDLLLKSGWFESIIELPAGSLNFGGVKVCVVVFSRNNEKVNILNCDNVIQGAKGRFSNYRLPYNEVLNALKEAPAKDINELLKANSLVPSSLIAGEGMIVDGTPLKKISTIITGCQYTSKHFEDVFSEKKTGRRILTSSDIKDGVVDWDALQSIDFDDDKFDKYALAKDDVVVTAKSTKVKVAVVDIEPTEKLIVTGGMLIIRPNTEALEPTFLKIFLNSNKGQAALKTIQKGSYIVSMNAKDLESLMIPDVSIKAQINYSKKYNAKLSTYLALKEELKKLEKQINDFDVDNMEE